MRARQVVREIETRGGWFVRQSGSHAIYRGARDNRVAQTVVPMHRGDVPIGTLRAIERQLAPLFGEGWLLG